MLIDNGADINIKDHTGKISELVSRFNAVELFKKVISLGAKLEPAQLVEIYLLIQSKMKILN